MRALASVALASVALAAVVAGCAVGLGPLPAEVEDLVDYLERRSFRLTPDATAYDTAFERVDPEAHVVSFRVRAAGLTLERQRSAGAILDVYRFGSAAKAESGIAGLRRIHSRGDLYVEGTTVVHVRGREPDLDLALVRRYGTPLDV